MQFFMFIKTVKNLELLKLNKMATKKMTRKAPVKKYQDGGSTGFEKRQAKKIWS